MKIYFAKRALALAASCSFVCLRERKNPGKTIPFTRPKFWQGENHSRKVVLFPVWNVVHYLGWTLTEIYVEKNLSMRFLFPKNMFYTKTRIHVQTKFLKNNPLFVPPKISASCAHTLAAVDNPPDPVREIFCQTSTRSKKRGWQLHCIAVGVAATPLHTEAAWAQKLPRTHWQAESNYPSATMFFRGLFVRSRLDKFSKLAPL